MRAASEVEDRLIMAYPGPGEIVLEENLGHVSMKIILRSLSAAFFDLFSIWVQRHFY